MKLDDGMVGEEYIVRGMDLPLKAEKRLEALGVINGTKLKLLNKKRSALVVNIRGSRFALGKIIAQNIEVGGRAE